MKKVVFDLNTFVNYEVGKFKDLFANYNTDFFDKVVEAFETELKSTVYAIKTWAKMCNGLTEEEMHKKHFVTNKNWMKEIEVKN